MKIISEDKVSLAETQPGSIAFVKLYLFEKDIIDSLSQHLRKEQKMELKPISSKCSGLKVLTPVHKQNNDSPKH